MITSAIREDLLPVTLDWISALRNADIRKLFKDQKDSEIDTELCVNELQPSRWRKSSVPFPGAAAGVPVRAFAKNRNREQLTETILTEKQRRRSAPPLSANRDRTISDAKLAASKSTSTSPSPMLLWSRNQQRIHNDNCMASNPNLVVR